MQLLLLSYYFILLFSFTVLFPVFLNLVMYFIVNFIDIILPFYL